MGIFDYTARKMGETHGLFHGKRPCLHLVGFMGLVDQTVIAAMFLILENVLAFQDSRSRIIQTGLWVVNQRSIFLEVKMRPASFN